VTPADRRLATLAAAWAGARAGPLLARLASPGVAEIAAFAVRLAGASRPERLRALAAELAPDPRVLRARAEAAAAQERAAVARLLAAIPAGGARARGAAPHVRLCREAVST
jgi:hypothetical protein